MMPNARAKPLSFMNWPHSLDLIGCNVLMLDTLTFAIIIYKVYSITTCLPRCLLQSIQKLTTRKFKSDIFNVDHISILHVQKSVYYIPKTKLHVGNLVIKF